MDSGSNPSQGGPGVTIPGRAPTRYVQLASPSPDLIDLTIVYGSQTGNAEALAEEARQRAENKGFSVSLVAADDFELSELATIERLLLITSTYDDGDMPHNALNLWDELEECNDSLSSLHYAVLAIGDSNYDDFCGAGRRFDERLFQLGATRILARADCDLDYAAQSDIWIGNALDTFASPDETGSEPSFDVSVTANSPSTAEDKWTRRTPFLAPIAVTRRLSGPLSKKDIYHHEIDLSGSGIRYQVGDSISVIPVNDQELVDGVLDTLGQEHRVHVPACDKALGTLLTEDLELRLPSREFIQDIGTRAADPELRNLFLQKDRQAIDSWLRGMDVLDLLQLRLTSEYTVDEFVALLRPLQHRTYSISSSPLLYPDTAHLTVSQVRYRKHSRLHRGIASHYLACDGPGYSAIKMFMTPTKDFRLPVDGSKPVIMVGPGTGIAPFRAFLQEREAAGAPGKNWLFFGDQHEKHDYIYKDELNAWSTKGILTRLDLAFSRDQRDKLYVQHKMLDAGKELFAWLEEGAHFYVCGDVENMASDVDAALRTIIATHGNLSAEEVQEYISQLKSEGRYLRDVY